MSYYQEPRSSSGWVIFLVVVFVCLIGFVIFAKPLKFDFGGGTGFVNSSVVFSLFNNFSGVSVPGVINLRGGNETVVVVFNGSYGESRVVSSPVLSGVARSPGFFDRGVCVVADPLLPPSVGGCKVSGDCDSGYVCDAELCVLDGLFGCDLVCSGGRCGVGLVKRAKPVLGLLNWRSDVYILDVGVGEGEVFEFPFDICLRYSPFDFDSVGLSGEGVSVKPIAANPWIDKCYSISGVDNIFLGFSGGGEVYFELLGVNQSLNITNR